MKAILMAIALLVIGFVLLIKGADYFVDGSSAVAKKLKVPVADYWIYDRGDGDEPAGVCGKRCGICYEQ